MSDIYKYLTIFDRHNRYKFRDIIINNIKIVKQVKFIDKNI